MPYLDPTTLITRYIEEVVNGGNLAVVDTYIAPTYVRHDPGLPFDVQGPDGVRQLVTVYRTAFPDIHFDRQALVGDRDVILRAILRMGLTTKAHRGFAAKVHQAVRWARGGAGWVQSGRFAAKLHQVTA